MRNSDQLPDDPSFSVLVADILCDHFGTAQINDNVLDLDAMIVDVVLFNLVHDSAPFVFLIENGWFASHSLS